MPFGAALQDDGGRFQCEGEPLRVEWTRPPRGDELPGAVQLRLARGAVYLRLQAG